MAEHPSILDALEREWRQLAAAPAWSQAVRRWGAVEPALDGCASPAEVLARCRRREDPAAANAVVGALMRRAHSDPVAARVLLQALLPGLRARLGRVRRQAGAGRPLPGWADLDELASDLVAMTVERIHDLAGTSPAWPARVVVDGVWRRVRYRAERARRAEAGVVPLWEDSAVAEPSTSAAEELGRVVVQAVAADRLTRPAAATLFATRVLGYSVAEVAAASGRDVRAVRVQRARAEHALVARVG